MPVDLEGRFKRLLKEIVTISSGIRNSALDHANDQNFDISEKFRRQLEKIRASADAILEAFAKATLTSHTLDDRITDWLMNGAPRLCLDKLKELEDMLRPVEQTQQTPDHPSMPAENKLVSAMNFLDKNNTSFHFLLTPDAWNSDRPIHLPQGPQAAQSSANAEHEPRPLPDTDEMGPKREFMRQKLDEISRWLAPLECARKHRDALRLRQEGTCKWFPHTDAYKTWRAPGNRFLWLHGKAGCGKSVLIASTIEHLQTGLGQEEAVVFFYCDFQNKRSTSSTELMRSLLSQLLRHLRDREVDPGDFPEKILKQKSQGTLSLDDLGKLCDLVSRAASFFRYEPMVVIDALDECADIEALLPALLTLSQCDVRLLVTSRPDQAIMDHFARLQSLSLEDVNEAVAADIALHVRREVGLHNCLTSAVPELKDEIDAKLIGKAEGRFRWVQCQLDTLKRCATTKELSEALDSLPDELGVTYERILGMIDERKLEGELARRVLALLMVAIEPLKLVQVIDGLAMDFQKRKHDHKARRWLETKLLHSLSSLVSYHEETDVLTLSHYSVKEYLTGRSALPTYQIVVQQAHAQVAQMCMGYISVYLKSESSHDNLDCFPMIYYVFSSGLNHLAHVDSESPMALEALQSLGSDFRCHPSHWDRLCDLREGILEWPYVPWPSSKHDFALYILIAYSSPGLLRTFLSSSYPLQPRIRTNPLVYAADLRKTEHAMVLLAHGADVDARGFVTDGSYSASALQIAVDLGDDVLVGELLQRGCLMTSELLSTAVCMPWCSTRVLAKLTETDEFAEWALEIGEEKLYRSVFSSARPDSGDSKRTEEDHLVLARRLRQLGLGLSPQSRFGRALIERALHAAHTSMLEFLLPPDRPPPARFLLAASTGDTSETVPVVRFLLERGVDVHAVSHRYRDTALHLAAMCPWEPRSLELTRLLIDAGCDPHALNLEDEISLAIAVRRGHRSVVEFLLSCHVPLPPDILHTALRRRQNPQMIEFLLRSGADPHVAHFTGNSILHSAIIGPRSDLGGDGDEDEESDDERPGESECFNFVKCFLEAGCDPTTRNSSGKTAMELAIEREFTSVVEHILSSGVPLPPNALLSAVLQDRALKTVECLIRNGANVHSTTSHGETVLHLILSQYSANEEERCQLAKALIDAGCDVTARNSTRKTALEIAVKRNFTSVVELLLSSHVPLPPGILLSAIQDGCALKMVELLVQKGVDVHSTTFCGDTALHVAIILSHDEETCRKLSKTLIDAGCDTTVRNSTGKTALECAVKRNFISVVELLLSFHAPLPPDVLLSAIQDGRAFKMVEWLIQKGADVHCTTSYGDTALHLAIIQSHDEETYRKLAKTLIDAGCNTTVRNSTGKTALEIAVDRNFTSAVVEHLLRLAPRNHTEGMCCKLAKRLNIDGSDIIAHNSATRTALEIAMEHSFTSVVELLLSRKVPLPPNPLLTALRRGFTLETIESLVNRGNASIHSTTSDWDTVLHLALSTSHYSEETCCKLAKRFIDAGCDTTTRNAAGKTALEIAMQRNFISVVELLLPKSNASLPPNVLLIALRQRSTFEMVEYLIHRGADLHSIASDGDTALHLALGWKYSEETSCRLVKRLIVAGCDTTARNFTGETALEIAMQRHLNSVVEQLLPSDAPLPADVLSIALQRRSTIEMVYHLIRRGADVLFTTPNGDTMLHLVLATRRTEKECCELMQYFIEAGCNPSTSNSHGNTVLLAAITRGYPSVVELLFYLDVPIPPNILRIALERRCEPQIIQVLVRKLDDNDHLRITSGSDDWDTLLQLANRAYSRPYSQQVIQILESARKACRTRPRPEDEINMHVTKKPRLAV